MFCSKCGNALPEDVRFCPNCGAEAARPQEVAPTVLDDEPKTIVIAPEEVPVATPAEVPAETPAAPVEAPAEMPAEVPAAPIAAPKKKKGKKLGIILGIAAALLVAVGAVLFVFRDAIFGSKEKPVPAEEIFRQAEIQALPDTLSPLTNFYALLLESANPVGNETAISLQLSNTALDFLADTAGLNDVSYLTWLKDLNIVGTIYTDADRIRADITLQLGNTKITDISLITDSDFNQVYLAFPDLGDTYYPVSNDIVIYNDPASALFRNPTFFTYLPDAETFQQLLTKYLQIAIENTPKMEKESISLLKNGVEQQVLAIRCDLSEKDLVKIAKAVLKEARDDEALILAMENVYGYLYNADLVYDADFRTMFQSGVDAALEQLDNTKASKDVILTLTDYINEADNAIVGRKLETPDGVIFEYATATAENGAFGTEVCIGEVLTIFGSGSVFENTKTADYILDVQGAACLTLHTSYDLEKLAAGQFYGTIRLFPESGLLDEMELDDNVRDYILDNHCGLEVIYTGNHKNGTASINILSGDEVLFGYTVRNTEVVGMDVQWPDNTDYSNTMEDWLVNLDFMPLINALRQSSFPKELTDSLEATLYPVEVPESALEILETVWAAYDDYNKFPVFGGNQNDYAVMENPGAFDITDTDGLAYLLLVPETQLANIDGAASMVHLMNANSFTCGVFHVTGDVETFATAMKDSIGNNPWMCGMPDQLFVAVVGGEYVLAAFGTNDAMNPFIAAFGAAYPDAVQLFAFPIA